MSESKPGLISTLLSINISKNYDRDVAPDLYEKIVKLKGRTRLGKHIAETLSNFLPSEKNSSTRVLDLGAGTGLISEELHQRGYQVTAADLSKNSLAYLREKRPYIDAVQLNMNQNLPFSNESFDGITTVASNRYIDDTAELLSETCRILKPGGVFLWPVFTSESLTSLKSLHMLLTLNPKRLREQALNAGYKDVKIIKPGLKEIFNIMVKKLLQPEYIPNFIVAIK